MRRALILTLFLVFPFGSLSAAPETVTSSVGQVGEHIVTSREVWISNFIERWTLTRRSNGSAKTNSPEWKPALKSDAFNQATSTFMLELMVAFEAENFSVAQVNVAEVKEQVQNFSKAFSSHPEWTRLEVSSTELEKFIERKRRAQNFLKFKTDSAGVAVTDDEAKAYFEKNRMKFGNHPFTQFKESIKEVLARQLLEERLKEWFEVLRRKYRVRFLSQVDSE